MKVRMIDPPGGWRYGFPKPFTAKPGVDMNDWLVENGYPKKEISNLGAHFFVRMWEQEDE